MPLKPCIHGRNLCSNPGCTVITDAAKRCYDEIREIVEDTDYSTRTITHSWVAIRLSDGGTDKTCYDRKQAAVQHQLHEQLCAYMSFRNAPNGFASPLEAQIFLNWNRQAYDNGMRMPDPDDASGGPDLIMPSMDEHLRNQMSRLGSRLN